MGIAVVILAAGMGKRMKSDIPKVLHPVLGRPMLGYVVDTVEKLSPDRIVLVIGHGGDGVKSAIGSDRVVYVTQVEQLGTGDAVKSAKKTLSNFQGDVLIINGDFPLITTKTLKNFLSKHIKGNLAVSILSSDVDNPRGYGRIVRDNVGVVQKIVEEKEATPLQKDIKEINSGTYCVNSKFLWKALSGLNTNNKQKEFYLTDIVHAASKKSLNIQAFKIDNGNEVLGVNDRSELALVERLLKEQTNEKFMTSGVTLIDPANTYISPDVKIARDNVIYPHTYIYGDTVIGSNCTIGPSVWIEDTKIGRGVTVRSSCYITDAVTKNDVSVGPFTQLRPDAEIHDGAKIGNFVEIKKSKIGPGSKVSHLSYIGDATLGRDVNIGAGTITCNYDGYNKHRTEVADNVFIGSDTMLVAPVKVGKGASTGAGSTITKDVPDGALAISRARQTLIENWQKRTRKKKGKK